LSLRDLAARLFVRSNSLKSSFADVIFHLCALVSVCSARVIKERTLDRDHGHFYSDGLAKIRIDLDVFSVWIVIENVQRPRKRRVL